MTITILALLKNKRSYYTLGCVYTSVIIKFGMVILRKITIDILWYSVYLSMFVSSSDFLSFTFMNVVIMLSRNRQKIIRNCTKNTWCSKIDIIYRNIKAENLWQQICFKNFAKIEVKRSCISCKRDKEKPNSLIDG